VGFAKEKFKIENENLLHFLEKTFKISEKEAKRMVNRGRVALNGDRIKHYNKTYSGILDIIYFKPEPLGIKPIFEVEDFAVFDKPSGVAIHPKGFAHSQTLLDDVRFLYGKDANLAHRLDKETSGLVIASKNKWSEKIIKKMFEDKEIQLKVFM
jgi:23S rRNA pseudouridine1911/1915/1917 synthase